MWGLSLLVHVVAARAMSAERAVALAWTVRATNPLLPRDAVERLMGMLAEAELGAVPEGAMPRRGW